MTIVGAWVQRAPVLPVTQAPSGRRASPAPTGVGSPRRSTPGVQVVLAPVPAISLGLFWNDIGRRILHPVGKQTTEEPHMAATLPPGCVGADKRLFVAVRCSGSGFPIGFPPATGLTGHGAACVADCRRIVTTTEAIKTCAAMAWLLAMSLLLRQGLTMVVSFTPSGKCRLLSHTEHDSFFACCDRYASPNRHFIICLV
jgi:hypothetical protein